MASGVERVVGFILEATEVFQPYEGVTSAGQRRGVRRGFPVEHRREEILFGLCAGAHLLEQRGDFGGRSAALVESFAEIHHLEQERLRGAVGVTHGETVRGEQSLGAGERIAKGAEGFVDRNGAIEGHPALAGRGLHVAVRVECAGEVSVPLLERGAVEGEAPRYAKKVEGISHG